MGALGVSWSGSIQVLQVCLRRSRWIRAWSLPGMYEAVGMWRADRSRPCEGDGQRDDPAGLFDHETCTHCARESCLSASHPTLCPNCSVDLCYRHHGRGNSPSPPEGHESTGSPIWKCYVTRSRICVGSTTWISCGHNPIRQSVLDSPDESRWLGLPRTYGS